MSDHRALLEAAARAAGVVPDRSRANGGPSINDGFDTAGNIVTDWHNGVTWNPITDDGDAFRLAVSLGIANSCRNGNAQATIKRGVFFEVFDEPAGTDPMAATRLAVTRAAAAMDPAAHVGGEAQKP